MCAAETMAGMQSVAEDGAVPSILSADASELERISEALLKWVADR